MNRIFLIGSALILKLAIALSLTLTPVTASAQQPLLSLSLSTDNANEVYLNGLGDQAPAYPVAWRDLEAAALAAMTPQARGYVSGGAGGEVNQDREPCRPVDDSADRRALEPDQEITLPMTGNSTVIGLGRAFADERLGGDVGPRLAA